MQILERNIIDRVISEVNIVETTVKDRVYDAVLAGLNNLVFTRFEIALRAAETSSWRAPKSV